MAKQAVAGPAALVLTATVARRYYFDGESKSDIAEQLGLSRFKVARLLDQARETGLVRIELDYRGELDLDLSVRCARRTGSGTAWWSTRPTTTRRCSASLGRASARLLTEIVAPDDVLGLAWARSLMAMRSALTRLAPCPVVQLTGALSRPDVDESSIELVRDVARISGGDAYYFYAPMILPDAATARALRTQPEVARAISRFPARDEGRRRARRVGGRPVDGGRRRDRCRAREMYALGVRAELCGVQLDADGGVVATSITDRLIGIDAEGLRAIPDVIALAYGTAKAEAVRAGLRGGFATSLVTHASMARRLLDEE